MQTTIDETNRRRSIQMAYNETHNITPTTVSKTREEILSQKSILDIRGKSKSSYSLEENDADNVAADPEIAYMTREQLEKLIADNEIKMRAAAKDLDFITAAALRDEIAALKKKWHAM